MLMAYTGLAHVRPDLAGDVIEAWKRLLDPKQGHVTHSCGLKAENRSGAETLVIFNLVLVEENEGREDFIRKATDAVRRVHPKLRSTDGKSFVQCTEAEQEIGLFYPIINISMTTNDTASAHGQFAYWSKLP